MVIGRGWGGGAPFWVGVQKTFEGPENFSQVKPSIGIRLTRSRLTPDSRRWFGCRHERNFAAKNRSRYEVFGPISCFPLLAPAAGGVRNDR